MTLIAFVNFHAGIKWNEYIYTSTIISVFTQILQEVRTYSFPFYSPYNIF